MKEQGIELLKKIANSKSFLGEGRIGTKKFAILFSVIDDNLILNLQRGEDSETIQEKDMVGIISCSIGCFSLRFNKLLSGSYWKDEKLNYTRKEIFIRPIDKAIMREIYKFFIEKLHNEAPIHNRATGADTRGE